MTYVGVAEVMRGVAHMNRLHDRVRCAAAEGVDYHRVVRYYAVLRSLERALNAGRELRRPDPPVLPNQRDLGEGEDCC